MKKTASFVLTTVLTAALLVGCGCTNQNKDITSAPTVLPTNEEVWDTTEATTRATTESTMSTQASETIDHGNGPLEDMIPGSTTTSESTGTTEGTAGTDGGESRSRSATGRSR